MVRWVCILMHRRPISGKLSGYWQLYSEFPRQVGSLIFGPDRTLSSHGRGSSCSSRRDRLVARDPCILCLRILCAFVIGGAVGQSHLSSKYDLWLDCTSADSKALAKSRRPSLQAFFLVASLRSFIFAQSEFQSFRTELRDNAATNHVSRKLATVWAYLRKVGVVNSALKK